LVQGSVLVAYRTPKPCVECQSAGKSCGSWS